MIKQKGELFTSKMFDLYGSSKDLLEEYIRDRETYESAPQDYPEQVELLKMHDLYISVKDSDKEISDAILATCYWYIYMNFMSHEENFIYTDDKGIEKLNMNALATFLIRQFCIVTANDSPYLYINDRYYEEPRRLSKSIVKILRRNGYSDEKKIEPIARDLLYRIRNETAKFKNPFNAKSQYFVPVANGVIMRRKLDILLPKSPVWGFTYNLPVVYNKDADPEPVLHFIRTIVDTEDVKFLTQIPAQALMQIADHQLAYLLTGDGANGKSTYISLITSLVGKINTTSISLQEIGEQRFAAIELYGKLMNLYADLPRTGLKETGKIKILTGGDYISVEKKFGARFLIKNKATFVFSANELPQVDDGTYAFWRRWVLIEFPNKFKSDPSFISRLITPENLSGFLNVVIAEMNKIERDGLERSSKVDSVMEIWKMRSNSAYAFVKLRLEKSSDKHIPKSVLYNEYSMFCKENDLTEVTRQKLKQQIEKDFAVIDGKIVSDRQNIAVIKGITFKDVVQQIKPKPVDETEKIKPDEDGSTHLNDFSPNASSI